MSYDNPTTEIARFALMDFGAATGSDTVHYIVGPKGKTGQLIDVGVALREATVFATTLGIVKVGTVSDDDAYAQLNIATGQAINTSYNSDDDTDAIISSALPADTLIMITLVEGTGAGLTGQGVPYLEIEWS